MGDVGPTGPTGSAGGLGQTRTVGTLDNFGSPSSGTDLVQEAFCDPNETLISCGLQAATLDNGNEVDLSGSFYHVGGLLRVAPTGGIGPGCRGQITIDKSTGNQDVLFSVQAFCASP